MPRKRRSHNFFKSPSADITQSDSVPYLRSKEKIYQAGVERLDQDLQKILQMSDSQASAYLRKIADLLSAERRLPPYPEMQKTSNWESIFARRVIEERRQDYKQAWEAHRRALEHLESKWEDLHKEFLREFHCGLWECVHAVKFIDLKGCPFKGYESVKAEIVNLQTPSDLRNKLASVNKLSDSRKVLQDIKIKIAKLTSQPKYQKEQEQRARLAAANNKTRSAGRAVASNLAIKKECPYCLGPLGSNFQADHIYPVALGGQSSPQNMVNVCLACNQRKGKMTLSAFCEKEGLDYMEVSNRLRKDGKNP